MDDTPLVSRDDELTPAHVERAKRIVERHDPRRARAGALRTVTLSQEELDLAVGYLAGRYAEARTRIALQPGAAAIAASIELPRNPVGRYLNVTALLAETGGWPRFDQLTVGRLPVPAPVADWLLGQVVERLSARDDYRVARDTIRKVTIADGRFTVVYEWQADLPDRIRAAAVPAEEQQRLRAYQERLAELARQSTDAPAPTLADLLSPLFGLAAQRSSGGDPRAENRAAIVVLAFYVNGKGLDAIVPAARDWARPTPRKVVLAGREDFPQHYTLSAAIAASAGGPLADAIGLYKEIADSQAGSGFSFTDIAADRAGARFGEIAVRSPESALRLQRDVSAGVRETDLVPAVKDLPEFMPEAEFKRRFGGVGAPRYQSVIADIDRRLGALPLYR